MFISYRDVQEKVDYLRRTGHLNGINTEWLFTTLEQLNRKAERYEEVISAIANIDAVFIGSDDEDAWDSKQALEKIEQMVNPIWEEVVSRPKQFGNSDLDYQEVIRVRKETESKTLIWYEVITKDGMIHSLEAENMTKAFAYLPYKGIQPEQVQSIKEKWI